NINPVALNLLQFKLPNGQYLIPTPQVIIPSRPFASSGLSTFSQACHFDDDQFMINLDFAQTAKSKFSGRFFHSSNETLVSLPSGNTHPGNVPGFPLRTEAQVDNFSLTHSYVFSPVLFNEVRFGFLSTPSASKQESPFKYSDVGINASPQYNALP